MKRNITLTKKVYNDGMILYTSNQKRFVVQFMVENEGLSKPLCMVNIYHTNDTELNRQQQKTVKEQIKSLENEFYKYKNENELPNEVTVNIELASI